MKRTLVVLALAVISSAGCRAMNMNRGSGCSDACECGDSCGSECSEPYYGANGRRAGFMGPNGPTAGRGGNLEASCPGGQGCCFDRHCGSQCGPGYHPGPYDCSPCGSPHWGCTGHRHPQGYVDGRGCLCNCQGQVPGHCHTAGPHCAQCGGYCGCGPPSPGCTVCCCGASGDHNYNFNPGPPVAQTAYPYYTLRGPRDFLLDNPSSIGPY